MSRALALLLFVLFRRPLGWLLGVPPDPVLERKLNALAGDLLREVRGR